MVYSISSLISNMIRLYLGSNHTLLIPQVCHLTSQTQMFASGCSWSRAMISCAVILPPYKSWFRILLGEEFHHGIMDTDQITQAEFQFINLDILRFVLRIND